MVQRFTERRSSWLSAGLFGIMIAVLPLLAFLQYRWISEAGDAAEQQLRDNLNLSTSGFQQDFEDQLRRLSNGFRQSGPAEDNEIAEQYRQAYDSWTATSSFPELLEDGYLVRPDERGNMMLLRFNVQSKGLDPIDWPRDLASLRDAFLRNVPGRPLTKPSAAGIPAIVIPRMAMRLPPDRGRGPGRGFPGFDGGRRGPPPHGQNGPPGPPPFRNEWIVLRLNQNFFQNKFLPQLVTRHFAVGNESDNALYDVLIRENLSGNTIYKSGPNGSPEQFGLPDVRLSLSESDFDRPPFGPRGGPSSRLETVQASGWELLVKHRMGSLHAAAGQLRRRNLAIGIGILAILAIGLAATWMASERVRSLGRMQIELAAGISHELRTPLAVIRSAGYNMIAGNVTSREDIVRYGHLFQDQGKRLSEVIEQALLFAQTHSGKNTYTLEPVDAAEVVSKVIDSCRVMDPQAGSRIITKIAEDLPLAMTDATALSHCLHNLMTNALKYGGPAGDITVELRPFERKGNQEIEIAVADSGPGIETSDLPHLFSAFFRGRNTNRIQGNGLGLYLVKRTMESIHGDVTVASRPGSGARFALHVPSVPESDRI